MTRSVERGAHPSRCALPHPAGGTGDDVPGRRLCTGACCRTLLRIMLFSRVIHDRTQQGEGVADPLFERLIGVHPVRRGPGQVCMVPCRKVAPHNVFDSPGSLRTAVP
jgi:hypothetical protein